MNIPKFKIETLVNKPGNEMWRIGVGLHAYRGFFRIDIGSVGYRITRDFDYADEYDRLYPLLTEENQTITLRYMHDLMDEARNDTAIETTEIVRGGNQIIRQRKDLFQKMWARTRELLRTQRTMQ